MPRPSKIEISAMNIRIPADKERDYTKLVELLGSLKTGVKVYGDSFVAVSGFDPETGMGIFSKYSEIDIDGDWFNIDDFDIATDQDVDEVTIPDNLRPNHSAFYFQLSSDLHVISFETYSESKGLSSRSVERYFREILKRSEVVDRFGRVESDIVKSYSEVEKILALPQLKSLKLTIRRPNPDDISGDLASEIEKRLSEQNAEEYEEKITSRDDDGLLPNHRTKTLSVVAAENGQVSGKSIVNGVLVDHETSEKPLKEVESFNKDEQNPRGVFLQLTERIFGQIGQSRRQMTDS